MRSWFDDDKKQTVKQITDLFYKSARDFKNKKLNIQTFSKICDELLFGVYLSLEATNPKLDSRVEIALWKFASPSSEEADGWGFLKKKLQGKYLWFVRKKQEMGAPKWFRELIEKYSSPSLVRSWFDDNKKPTVKQITDLFYKSARDFKAGNLSLRDFSDICGELYFNAYLGDRRKFPTGLTISGPDHKVRAELVKVSKKGDDFIVTKSKLPPLKPDLDPRVTRAISEFSDPSNKNEVDRYWRLKKEFHEKYLSFVKKSVT